MRPPDLLRLFVRPLHEAGWRYLITGSVGSTLYGEARLTMDVDLAVAVSEGQVERLHAIFPDNEFYVPPPEVLRSENVRPRGHWNVIHSRSGLKADFYPAQGDPWFSWAWDRRRESPLDGGEIFYAPPEYVLAWKVRWYSEGYGEKHVRDVLRICEVSGKRIDEQLLRGALEPLNLWPIFEKMKTGGGSGKS